MSHDGVNGPPSLELFEISSDYHFTTNFNKPHYVVSSALRPSEWPLAAHAVRVRSSPPAAAATERRRIRRENEAQRGRAGTKRIELVKVGDEVFRRA